MIQKRLLALAARPPVALALAALFTGGLSPNVFANSVLTIEAENFSQTTGSGWSTETDLDGFNGSAYIVWRGADDFRATDDDPPAGIKAYDFLISTAGTYQFEARVQARVGNGSAAADADNDGWVKFTSGNATNGIPGDASKWTKFFISGPDEKWDNYSTGEQYDPNFFTAIQRDLTVGQHRILVGGRSARFAVDSVGLALIQAMDVDSSDDNAEVISGPMAVAGDGMSACSAIGTSLADAKTEYSNNCPSIPRVDCDPLADSGWICSSENISSSTTQTPTEPSTPVSSPAPAEPEMPVAGGACTAMGATLGEASNNYADACPTLQREDCDPLPDGSWLCSSENISGIFTVSPTESATPDQSPTESEAPSAPTDTEVPATPDTPVTASACTSSGSDLSQAKDNFVANCPSFVRNDCDPVSDGGWMCSSEIIGASSGGSGGSGESAGSEENAGSEESTGSEDTAGSDSSDSTPERQ